MEWLHNLVGANGDAIIWWQMVTERDLMEQLREALDTDDLGRVRDAYPERGGHVSFIVR